VKQTAECARTTDRDGFSPWCGRSMYVCMYVCIYVVMYVDIYICIHVRMRAAVALYVYAIVT